jgi:hypothetical protein
LRQDDDERRDEGHSRECAVLHEVGEGACGLARVDEPWPNDEKAGDASR